MKVVYTFLAIQGIRRCKKIWKTLEARLTWREFQLALQAPHPRSRDSGLWVESQWEYLEGKPHFHAASRTPYSGPHSPPRADQYEAAV